MKTNVVIIGAGPAGIFTALEMLKKGTKKKIVIDTPPVMNVTSRLYTAGAT